MSTNETKTPEPVLVTQAALVALHLFFGGGQAVAAFIENDPTWLAIFAFGNLATAALQGGVAYYVRGQVVPVDAVVERVDGHGQVVAGPANTLASPGDVVRRVAADPVVAEAGGSAVD